MSTTRTAPRPPRRPSQIPALAILALGLFFACKNDPKTPPAGPDSPGQNVNPELLALTEALQKDPENDSLRYRRAALFYKLEGFDEAIADLRAAITLDSMQPQYYHLLADVYLDYNRSQPAMRAMEFAVWKFPERIPTLLKMSEVYLIVKRHGEALKMLDRILQREPQNAEAFFMTGRVALDMGDNARAVGALRKSVSLDAGNADAWEFLGRIFADKNDPLALQYYDNVLRLDSNRLDIRLFKGMFHKQRGDHRRAFEQYRDIIRRDPDNSDAFFDIGIMYLEQDSLDKAHDHFDIAIKTDPLFFKAFYYRGVTAEEKGNLDAALADYRQANKMSPNFQEAKDAVARLGGK